jgi:hypothetical protein
LQSIECRRSLDCGGGRSDVCCGWLPAIQALMRHRQGSVLGGVCGCYLPASLCSPKGAGFGRGLSRPDDEKDISPNSLTGSTKICCRRILRHSPRALCGDIIWALKTLMSHDDEHCMGRVRQAGVDSWCSEGIHRHFSFGGVEVDWIVWCDDGPSDGATAAIAAVKPCAFGAPLRGCGA